MQFPSTLPFTPEKHANSDKLVKLMTELIKYLKTPEEFRFLIGGNCTALCAAASNHRDAG